MGAKIDCDRPGVVDRLGLIKLKRFKKSYTGDEDGGTNFRNSVQMVRTSQRTLSE